MVEWEIRFNIEGSLKLHKPCSINAVSFKNKSNNIIDAIILVEAENAVEAENIAIRNVNDALDMLSLITNANLMISGERAIHQIGSNTHSQSITGTATISRVSSEDELLKAQIILDKVPRDERTLIRALGWYRKGLNGIDAFDVFLAFWNSIEIVTEKYGPSGENIGGSKDKMKSMLKTYLGSDYSEFVREYYEYRKNIAHGAKPIIQEQIRLVSLKTPLLKDIANRFLINFAESKYLPKDF